MNHYIVDEADLAFLDFTQSEEWIAYQKRIAQKEAKMQKIDEEVELFMLWLDTVKASDFGDGDEGLGAKI